MDKQKDSLYLPYRMIIEKITDEAPGVRTFRLKFKEEREGEDFHFKAGQFGEYSAFGEGVRKILVKKADCLKKRMKKINVSC